MELRALEEDETAGTALVRAELEEPTAGSRPESPLPEVE